MSNFKKIIYSYNLKIKEKGKKKYFLRLFITTILQTSALAIIPAIIDERYGTLYIKIPIIFIFFFIFNMFIGFFLIFPRL